MLLWPADQGCLPFLAQQDPLSFPSLAALVFSPLQAPGNHIYCVIAIKGLGNGSAADMDSKWSGVQIPHIPHHVRRASASCQASAGLEARPSALLALGPPALPGPLIVPRDFFRGLAEQS
jgi:hypothetical protein